MNADANWAFLQALRRAARDDANLLIEEIMAAINADPNAANIGALRAALAAAIARRDLAQQQIDTGNRNMCLGTLCSLAIVAVIFIVMFGIVIPNIAAADDDYGSTYTSADDNYFVNPYDNDDTP